MTTTTSYGVRYHVEGYGGGRTIHSVGDVLPLNVVQQSPGPEGYLHVRRDGDRYYIDECDEAVCPSVMFDAEVAADGGSWVVRDDEQ